jgi:glycosyltransferase involved in cell wall biosynthesis
VFTVIVPLFNKEYSIKDCLSSVFAQEGEAAFEVILVNDGSTDASLDVVKSNFESEIQSGLLKLISQENSGVSAARNKGVEKSRFNYLCFLDADDEWQPGFLSAISDLINSFPDAVMYSTGHFVKKKDKDIVIKRSGYQKDFCGYVDDFFISSTKGDIVNSSKVCMRKDVFEKCGGFPERAIIGEDLFLWIQAALQGKVAFNAAPLVTIKQLHDFSRFKRKNKVPYPISYYSANKMPNSFGLSRGLNSYLFMIFYKHFASSFLGFRWYEAYGIFKAYLKLRLVNF